MCDACVHIIASYIKRPKPISDLCGAQNISYFVVSVGIILDPFLVATSISLSGSCCAHDPRTGLRKKEDGIYIVFAPAGQSCCRSMPEIMADASEKEKPSVLIIGGLGYIGRFLALHIHKNNLASEVRLVDKILPQLAWLAPEFTEACSHDKFIQADASRERESVLSSRHRSDGLVLKYMDG